MLFLFQTAQNACQTFVCASEENSRPISQSVFMSFDAGVTK